MAERAFNIRLFLPDGDPSGRRVAVRSHHTAEIYCVTRAQFPSQTGDERLHRTGVYALVGPSELERFEQKLYVGQGGRVGQRVKAHLSGANAKDWWTEVFVLTKTDGELDQADIDHLEARLIHLAVDSDRLEIDNTNQPNPPPLADYKEAEVASFLDDVLPIYKALGLVAFEAGPERSAPEDTPPDGGIGEQPGTQLEDVPLFIDAVGVTGEGRSTRDGFVVLAGATVRKEETPTIPKNGRRKRQQLQDEGVLQQTEPESDNWTLTASQAFSSPSEAGYVLTGSSVSGPLYWKTEDGTALGDLQLAEAEAGEEQEQDDGAPIEIATQAPGQANDA